MPIVAADIQIRLSGGAANSNPNASLGGAKSSNVAPAALFDDVPASESVPGRTEYRCVYVHNNHGTLTLQNAVVWIESNTASPDTDIAIAAGGEGLNGTAETVANETTAPSGETFVAAPNQGEGVSLGNIPAGQHYPLWIRRVVNAGAQPSNDSFTIRIRGETAA